MSLLTIDPDLMFSSIASSMSEKIKYFEDRSMKLEEPIICRVPADIKQDHVKEYEPMILAIGPYHRFTEGQGGEIHPRLKPMEDMKLQFLIDLCEREANNQGITKDAVLETFTKDVGSEEINVRKKYSKSIFQRMSSEVFVEMLVLDGCFIIEYMLKVREGIYDQKDALPKTFHENIMTALTRDFLLFENQIPFFILEKILGSCSLTIKGEPVSSCSSIIDGALSIIRKENLPNEYRQGDNPKKIHHLLHLYHVSEVSEQNPIANSDEANDSENCTTTICNVIKTTFSCLVVSMIFILLIPVLLSLVLLSLIWWCWNYLWNTEKYETPMEAKLIPTATQLAEYGVKFRRKDISGGGNILDVSFEDGILEIPYVDIDDDTSSRYRNLTALEQSCNREYGNKFTTYVCFMDDLIDTANDVALLTKSKILDNNLGSKEEVAKLFNDMCIGLVVDENHYLAKMYEEINNYCNRKYNKWRATLMRDYVSSPWSIISVLAVSFVLCLAAVQTVCSIIQVI